MRLFVHIGLEHVGASRLQDVLAAKREQLLTKGILYPRSAGNKNHTRLFMAVTDADHVDPLRHNRGYTQTEDQQRLYESVARGLAQEIATHRPHTMILSASQLGASLARPSEIARLHDLLSPLSQDIRILAHVDEQARLLARHYGAQVMEGRAASLELELDMAGSADWWDDALLDGHVIDPDKGQYQETQCPAFWLDYPRLVHSKELGTSLFDPPSGGGSDRIPHIYQASRDPSPPRGRCRTGSRRSIVDRAASMPPSRCRWSPLLSSGEPN